MNKDVAKVVALLSFILAGLAGTAFIVTTTFAKYHGQFWQMLGALILILTIPIFLTAGQQWLINRDMRRLEAKLPEIIAAATKEVLEKRKQEQNK